MIMVPITKYVTGIKILAVCSTEHYHHLKGYVPQGQIQA